MQQRTISNFDVLTFIRYSLTFFWYFFVYRLDMPLKYFIKWLRIFLSLILYLDIPETQTIYIVFIITLWIYLIPFLYLYLRLYPYYKLYTYIMYCSNTPVILGRKNQHLLKKSKWAKIFFTPLFWLCKQCLKSPHQYRACVISYLRWKTIKLLFS